MLWKLDGKEIAWKKKIIRKKEKKIFECEECRNMFTGHRCPKCGYEVPNWSKKVHTTDDELEEIGKNRKKFTTEEKQLFYGMLVHEQRMKGYKQGWIYWKYKEKFKVKPVNMDGIGPIQPDEKFNNWMIYQRIKMAKRRANEERMQKAVGNGN
jgi:hypothetical protein